MYARKTTYFYAYPDNGQDRIITKANNVDDAMWKALDRLPWDTKFRLDGLHYEIHWKEDK